MSQEVTIKNLILAAAAGASEGVEVLQNANLAVELEEFEIEATYAAETSITTSTSGSLNAGIDMKFVTYNAKIGTRMSTRNKATYGMKVRFLFSGVEKDKDADE